MFWINQAVSWFALNFDVTLPASVLWLTAIANVAVLLAAAVVWRLSEVPRSR